MDNARINLELKEMRESINEHIENRKKKLEISHSLKKNEDITLENNLNTVEKLSIIHRKSSLGRLKSLNVNDEEYEKIKREKLEREYYAYLDELNQLKEEVFKFKIFMYLCKFKLGPCSEK